MMSDPTSSRDADHSSLAWTARLLLALLVFWLVNLARQHTLAIAVLALPPLLMLLLPAPRLGSAYARLLGPPPLPAHVSSSPAALVQLRAAEQNSCDRSMVTAAILPAIAIWLAMGAGPAKSSIVVPPVTLGLALVMRTPMLLAVSRFTDRMADQLGEPVRPLEPLSAPVVVATLLLLVLSIAITWPR